jgi:hypothetical protein
MSWLVLNHLIGSQLSSLIYSTEVNKLSKKSSTDSLLLKMTTTFQILHVMSLAEFVQNGGNSKQTN